MPDARTPVRRLRAMMELHSLSQRDVAELAMVSVKTVGGWLAHPSCSSHRAVRERDLMLMSYRLPALVSARCQQVEVESRRAG